MLLCLCCYGKFWGPEKLSGKLTVPLFAQPGSKPSWNTGYAQMTVINKPSETEVDGFGRVQRGLLERRCTRSHTEENENFQS